MVGLGEMHPIDKHRGPEAEAISGQLQGWEERIQSSREPSASSSWAMPFLFRRVPHTPLKLY